MLPLDSLSEYDIRLSLSNSSSMHFFSVQDTDGTLKICSFFFWVRSTYLWKKNKCYNHLASTHWDVHKFVGISRKDKIKQKAIWKQVFSASWTPPIRHLYCTGLSCCRSWVTKMSTSSCCSILDILLFNLPKAIIHVIDKKNFVEKEFGGLQKVDNNAFRYKVCPKVL